MFINAFNSVNLKPNANNVNFKSIDERVVVRDAAGQELKVQGLVPNNRGVMNFDIHLNREQSRFAADHDRLTDDDLAYVACYDGKPYFYIDTGTVCSCDSEGNPIYGELPRPYSVYSDLVKLRLVQLDLTWRIPPSKEGPIEGRDKDHKWESYLKLYPETDEYGYNGYIPNKIPTTVEIVND